MKKLKKSRDLKSIDLSTIKSSTINNCKELISAVSESVKKDLASMCSVVSIQHSIEVKAIIKNKTSKVKLQKKELAGNMLEPRNEPKELKFFSYDQLKKTAKFNKGIYRGKLYGTIESYTCNTTCKCPKCEGTGLCNNCDGEKQITCTLCNGTTKCISCSGSGRYTCKNCDGDGICPKCDEGWIECGDCSGSGTESCPDCCGTGFFVNECCNKCNGSGEYRYGVKCKFCNGTGRYTVECRKCDGNGEINCDNCDGNGGWNCTECHGSGTCSHCHGDGNFHCKACDGTGFCGKCKGKGKIWCPECQGKGKCFNCKGDKVISCPRCKGSGKYQTYTEYSFREEKSTKELFSFPIDEQYYSECTGELCYKGIVYDFFGKKASIFDYDKAINSLEGCHSEILGKWLSLDNNASFTSDSISDDYLYTYVEIYKVPVTKVEISKKSKNYNIWIVGNGLSVYYDKLPRKVLLGWLLSLFD